MGQMYSIFSFFYDDNTSITVQYSYGIYKLGNTTFNCVMTYMLHTYYLKTYMYMLHNYNYIHVCVIILIKYTSIFDKLTCIWCTIGPKSFLFGTAQFSLWARWRS